MEIRKAERKDLPFMSELYEIVANIYRQHHDIWEETENAGKRASLNYLNSPTSIAFVAEENGNILGFLGAQYKTLPSTFKNPFTMHITDVSVYPKHRKKGVATALINKVKEYAKEQKIRYVTLDVGVLNEPAKECYTNNGFETIAHEMVFEIK